MTYVSTIAKIVSLREHLNDSQLVGVLNEFGIPISNAKLSRAIDDGKFSSHDFDQRVRVVVLGIENLIASGAPMVSDFVQGPRACTHYDDIA